MATYQKRGAKNLKEASVTLFRRLAIFRTYPSHIHWQFTSKLPFKTIHWSMLTLFPLVDANLDSIQARQRHSFADVKCEKGSLILRCKQVVS